MLWICSRPTLFPYTTLFRSRINNGVKYGLSSSLYTRDVNAAFRAMHELDTGITYVNAPTIGAEAHLPFGGVKQTGNGHREGGWERSEERRVGKEWRSREWL